MKATVAQLVQLPGVWRGGELEHVVHPVVPTGHAQLDAELPGGGWPQSTLTEVLHEAAGIGEVSFLSGALRRAAEGQRLIAWVNPPHLPYAPAIAQSGLALESCLVIRPADREDALWAAEQSLKSGACGAVMLWMERFAEEYAWLRRLQMAAETGRCMAVLFRSTLAERHSTPSHLRVVVSAAPGVVKVRIPKRRGPPLVQPISLQREGARGDTCSGSHSSFPHSPSRSLNAPVLVSSRS
ncbi:MAG: translesion DNA synthesis-associated protein ImuA [Usitatibacter sp.]